MADCDKCYKENEKSDETDLMAGSHFSRLFKEDLSELPFSK